MPLSKLLRSERNILKKRREGKRREERRKGTFGSLYCSMYVSMYIEERSATYCPPAPIVFGELL